MKLNCRNSKLLFDYSKNMFTDCKNVSTDYGNEADKHR